MQLSSQLLEKAVSAFAKLPGIGKKTALRLVLHLLKQEAGEVAQFSEAITKLRSEIRFCTRCGNIADSTQCSICLNPGRKQQLICVVESIRDVIAIESTQQFNGIYHILGGIISPLDGIGPEQLTIDSLVARIKKEKTEEEKEDVEKIITFIHNSFCISIVGLPTCAKPTCAKSCFRYLSSCSRYSRYRGG